ncbi:MAG: HAD family phosphatase [Endomicrobium sp.]|jgi:beta-phosphoglucomutase|nr:HAD family phosphatase [Endomicrobium sp.]
MKGGQKMFSFKAILFDMDGTIVDSMPYHFISWFEVLKKYGVCVRPSTVFEMEGARMNEIIEIAFKDYQEELTSEIRSCIFSQREEIFKKYFQRHIFSGIREFIEKLKNKGTLLGLVSGSFKREVQHMLPKELYDLFDTVIGGDMVKKSKPYPEPYLTAAKNLNVSSEKCLVIENAPYGIKSAKSANMLCYAIATSLPKESLQMADKIFDKHKDLYDYLNLK